MQIQKANGQQTPNFGASIVIKNRETARFLNTLDSINLDWRNEGNHNVAYTHLCQGCGPDKDGFFRGLLADKAEARVLHGFDALLLQDIKDGKTDPEFTLYKQSSELKKHLVSRSKEVEVKTLEDLLKLPMLKGYKRQIRAMFKAC
jgi:hypothetical protein